MNVFPQSGEQHALEQQARAGASWTYWIAGATLINLFIVLGLGQDKEYFIVLFGPLLVAYLFHTSPVTTKVVVGLCCAIAIGIFALLGYFATKGHRWAIVAAIFCYGVDLAFWAIGGLWIGVLIHAFAIWRMSVGAKAVFGLAKLRSAAQMPGGYQGVRSMQDAQTPGAWPSPPVAPPPISPLPTPSIPPSPFAQTPGPPTSPLSQSPPEQPIPEPLVDSSPAEPIPPLAPSDEQPR